MSTANSSSDTTRTDTPRERAFALYCQGQRSPAIATQLGVPERTVRAWITSALRTLAEENAALRREHQALAIARYEAISNAAWEGYARAAALEQVTLTATLAALTAESAAASAPPASAPSTPASASSVLKTPSSAPSAPSCPSSPFVPFVLKGPAPSSGARYLAVAMAADREISRLQGLYLPEATKPHQDVKIILERREPTAENYPPGEYPGAPDHSAHPTNPVAPTAAPPDPARDGGLRGQRPLGADSSAGSPIAMPLVAHAPAGAPAASTPQSPAETATPSSSAPSCPPSPSVASVLEPPSSALKPPSSAPITPRIWKRRPGSPSSTGIYVTYGDSSPYGPYGDQR